MQTLQDIAEEKANEIGGNMCSYEELRPCRSATGDPSRALTLK
jgi:hypothetical protein